MNTQLEDLIEDEVEYNRWLDELEEELDLMCFEVQERTRMDALDILNEIKYDEEDY